MPLKETNWDDDIFTRHYLDKIYTTKRFIPKMNITEGFTRGHHLKMKKYINHISSYEPYLSELKRYIFTFKSSLLVAAKQKLSKHHYSEHNGEITFVSIHVRLTDYHTVLEEQNLPTISKKYFRRAMKHFTQKYKVRIWKHIF